MACVWAGEEYLTLPTTPHSPRWRVDLLREQVATEDGGTRLTRITPEG
ncbi:hypothetical protein [Jannaschia rubra]|nr:hypothetical protein [Jannaschia rubra]